MKKCSQCKETKELSEFRKHKKEKDGLQYACKMCQRKKRDEWMARNPGKAAAQSKAQRQKDPEKANMAGKKWRDSNPDKVKACFLKRYNLSLEQWNRMFDAQGGKCLICDDHQDTLTKELAVDHCHKTGKVRGLLCAPCNRALGLFRDSLVLLRSGVKYMEKQGSGGVYGNATKNKDC